MNRNQLDLNARGKRREANRNKTRKGLFLAVDILLLVAIIAAIFFLVVLLTPLNPFRQDDGTECTLLYTIELSNVEADVIDLLREGDRVIDAETGREIGEIQLKDKREYTYYSDVAVQNGDAYVVEKERVSDRYTVTLTIRADAVYEEGVGYSVDHCRVAVGREYELHFPSYAGRGVCVTLAKG